MNHGPPDKTITAIQQVLASFPAVEKALLYGSRAKESYKPGSDIDLTLVGHGLDSHLLSKIYWALDDLLLPYKIDLSQFSELRHPALIDHIRRAGIPIYAKSTSVLTE